MKKFKRFIVPSLTLLGASQVPCTVAEVAEELKTYFDKGTISGNIRAYYNTRDYEVKTDEAAFSLGGALRAETAPMGIVSLGVGFYTAQDLGTNDEDPAKVNGRLGSELEVLGEAYVKLSKSGHTARAGRIRIETPFANSGDAFIVPFAFEGWAYKYNSSDKLTFEVDYINAIKNRNSDQFVDVGIWSSNQFGIAEAQATSATVNLGATYKGDGYKLEAWGASYADFYNQLYLYGDYAFGGSDQIKPFIGVQFGMQQDSGDALLGDVESSIYGVNAGAAMGDFKVTLALNSVPDDEESYRNGAFLSPYTFSTSPLFTNNMLQTFENVDAGSAQKVTLNFNPTSQLAMKLSFATFDFDQVVDRDAVDADVTYKFANYLKGLSLRWRLEVVTSDDENVEQTNMRFQTQYVF
ncbi:MAG TPA: OprD family outer membrane porin [Marinagarivorans sp.]